MLEIMLRIQKLKKYEKDEIEQRLIKINKLSKKEVISNYAKDLLNSL